MNILFLTHRFPCPPDRGDRIRSYHIIKFLSKRHNIFLASVDESIPSSIHLNCMKEFCKAVIFYQIPRKKQMLKACCYLPTCVPLSLPLFYNRRLYKDVKNLLSKEKIDLIFTYCVSMAPYTEEFSDIPKVIDFIDSDSQKWLDYAATTKSIYKFIYLREGFLLRRYEKKVAKLAQHAFVASKREEEIFKRYIKTCPITTVLNGVSIPRYIKKHPSKDINIVFVGVMDYWPNVDAVTFFSKEVFPKIKKAFPNAKFFIVGKNPCEQVQQLSNISGVEVTGFVPDVKDYLLSATLCVVPLRIARGIQNKLLEAMAMKLPVVATSAATQGIMAKDQKDLLIADNPDDMAEKIIRLIKDKRLQEELSNNAFWYIKRYHDWEQNLKILEDIIVDIYKKYGQR